jgi:hypothetical protein
MMACAFETVGVTPSKVKGKAVASNVVAMRSFFMESSSIDLPSSSSDPC